MGDDRDAEASVLATQALELVSELEEEEDVDVGFEDFKAAKREAERLVAQGSLAEGLRAAVKAVEELACSTKLKERLVLLRIRELQWLVKDALAYFKGVGDVTGTVAALSALTRAHLLRASEPDAPIAALKAAREAHDLCLSILDDRVQAEVLLLLSEAHVAKALGTPYSEVLTEEVTRAAESARNAEALFRQLGDQRWLAKAMHATAKAFAAAHR